MRGQRLIAIFSLAVLSLPGSTIGQTQQPPPPPPPTEAPQADSSSGKKSPTRHQHDFLIKGTVFTPEGLSFAGAQIRIRKAGAKSFHWQSEANSRGEFAIRVVQGEKYEVVVSAKGFKPQAKAADATGSERTEEMVFHMERLGGKPS
jgi:carboxypeptidase family protein